MKLKNRVFALTGSILAASACLVGLTTPASASEAKSTIQHCVTLIKRIDPGKPASRVVSQTCEPGPMPDHLAVPATVTILGTVFGEEGMNGSTDALEGMDGTCDADGYDFSALDGPNLAVGGIRSYELYGNCTSSEYFSGYNFTGSFSGLLVTQKVYSLQFYPMNSINVAQF